MSSKFKVLIADDDQAITSLFEEILSGEGYQVTAVNGGAAALKVIRDEDLDMLITDIMMPEVSGLDILHEVKKNHPDTMVILITSFGTVEAAISAMKDGAYDYISKPFKIDEIVLSVRRALEQKELLKQYQFLQKGIKEKYKLENIVGRSNEMLDVYKTVAKIAPSRSTVLITGESGSGKELVARAIHQNSTRADKPFVVIQCASIPETLIEGELFGYMKGAFTGANATRRGLFEEADTGTCFLDEIGEIPLSTQVKLLRVIQEREVRRLGADHPIKIDVRIIAATNRKLEDMIKEGKFREDLYYRLSVVSIHLPPLRERTEDIPLLCQHFIRKYCTEYNKPIKMLSPEAAILLTQYNWPGNVRELENVIERAVNLSYHDVIMMEDLPDKVSLTVKSAVINFIDENITLDELEQKFLEKNLKDTNWNYTLTAEKMGISVRTIQRMVSRFNLKKPH